MKTNTALILGATGGIGGETARALLRRGWNVRALARDPQKAAASWPKDTAQPEWIRGDAMDAKAVLDAARGVALLVHAVNPPGYEDWDKLVVPMLAHSIEAARAANARLVLPGTLYNYGPDTFPEIEETAPQHPRSHKGELRVQMEDRLKRASKEGVRCMVVRAGDFFGPHSGNNWFSQGLVKPGQALTAVTNPGREGVGHQWSYLPDVAEAIAQLAEREDQLGPFENLHLRGHYDADGTQMVRSVARVSGRDDLPVKSFPWWALRLGSPFVPLFREMMEMRYLWERPVRMRNDRLVATLGEEPRTPLDVAVRSTLVGLGCLGPTAARLSGARRPGRAPRRCRRPRRSA